MIRDSINFELKDNIFALNNDFPDINKVNNIYIDKFIKDKNSFFSYNLTDNSNFKSEKGFVDSILNDYQSSENPQDNSSMKLNIKDIESNKEGKKKNSYQENEKYPFNSFWIFKSKKIYFRNTIPGNQIFNIEKIKKMGRIKKDPNKKGKHDKFKRDNIIRRFKVFITNNIFKYINDSFKINYNHSDNVKIRVLKKITSKKLKSISKEDNIKWFNSKIKDIFSENLSTKIANFELDFNKKFIKKISQEGKEKKVIDILEKTVKEMWIVYINNDKNNNFIGFDTIKDDIKKLRELGEIEEYIKHFIYIANNYEDIFNILIISDFLWNFPLCYFFFFLE